MKKPRYMNISAPTFRDGKLVVSISLEKWGIPLILFEALRSEKEYGIKRWLIYPTICIKGLRKGVFSD